MPKKTTTVCLEVEQLERLERLRRLTRVPTAERIREGINLALASAERELVQAGREIPPLPSAS